MKRKLKKSVALLLATISALSLSTAVFADEPTSFSIGKAVAPAVDKIVKVGGINYEITEQPSNFPGKCSVSVNDLCTITDVVIPSQINIQGKVYNVTAIAENAFAENKYIKTVQIGAKVETIAPTAFAGAMTLENIVVELGSDNFIAVEGILYTKDKTTVVACPMGKKIASYTAPNTVTKIAACAFYGNSEIYSVTLNNTKVSEIGDFAFTNCNKLAVVNLGYTINKIGMAAFAQTDLKTIVLPVYLKEIGSGSFAGTKISSVRIPDEITEIPYGAFSNCINLSSVKWGEKLQKIGDFAFANTALTQVEVTSDVKSIGYSAFAYCDKLANITIGKRVNAIGDNAFANCLSLTNISIPESVVKIGENAFLGCRKMISVAVDSRNTTYTAEDGVLYTKGFHELLFYPPAKPDNEFTVPVETISIRENAFDGANNILAFNVENGSKAYVANDGVLISVDGSVLVKYPNGKIASGYSVSENIYKIMPGAFSGALISGTVNIGNNVKEIGENAFAECKNVKEFNVAPLNSAYTSVDGVLYTKDKTYLINYPAKKIVPVFDVPDEVSVIKSNAFKYSEVPEVTLPLNTVEIGENAFANSKLEKINFPMALNVIDDNAFNNTLLVNVEIPTSVTEIGKYAFANSSVLSTVTFMGANNVSTVGANVFANDNALTKIYVPSAYLNQYKVLLMNMDVDNYAQILSPKL